jgi:hypothetical protein
MIEESKRCGKCSETKPFSAFSKHIRTSDGLESTCRDCRKLHSNLISKDEYQDLLIQQNNQCAICGVQPETINKALVIDHDHDNPSRGARGLLCTYCNVALGLLGEDIEILVSAIGYIKRNQNIVAHAQ